MARVTVEDCLARVPNRFALTILASRRARSLSEGRGRAMVECDNKEGVTALREVSADRVRYKEDVASTMVKFIEEQRRQLRVTASEHTFLEAASLRALEEDDIDLDDESDDIEELQADPEALNKQASKASEEESDDDGETTTTTPVETTSNTEETPEFDSDGEFSDDDLPEDVESNEGSSESSI